MNKPKYIAITASVTITISAWIFMHEFMSAVEYLLRLLNKIMSSWGLINPVFSLSIGLIPWLSYLIWKKGHRRSLSSLVSYWLIAWLMMIVVWAVAFWVVVVTQPPLINPLLPDYIVILPFDGLWNVVLPISTAVAVFFLRFLNSRKSLKTLIDDVPE